MDRRIDLNEVVIRACANVSAARRNDPSRDRTTEPKWIADRKSPIADAWLGRSKSGRWPNHISWIGSSSIAGAALHPASSSIRRLPAVNDDRTHPGDVHGNPSRLISLILIEAQIDVLWFASG